MCVCFFFQMGLFEGISVHICSYIIKWDFFDWKRQWKKKTMMLIREFRGTTYQQNE